MKKISESKNQYQSHLLENLRKLLRAYYVDEREIDFIVSEVVFENLKKILGTFLVNEDEIDFILSEVRALGFGEPESWINDYVELYSTVLGEADESREIEKYEF